MKSANQDNVYALYTLGKHYDRPMHDYIKALVYYHRSADLGYSLAQNAIGECYYYGHGVKKDYKEAV
jgi:TPR repeat protein